MALKGEKADGHAFVADAVGKGACGLITERHFAEFERVPQLVVADTLRALGDLAALWRSMNPEVPMVALSGSSGKTTTKEMAAHVVGASRRLLYTQGNLNNLIGLPQTLFGLDGIHEAAIVELGMNVPGELRRLTQIAQPDCVVISNITNAHIGMFGSQEALYEGECEVLDACRGDAALIMNADDPLSRRARAERAGGRPVVSYGFGEDADIRAGNVRPVSPFGYSFDLRVAGEAGVHPVTLSLFGRHNIYNALAAAGIARFFGLRAQETARRLGEFLPRLNRSEVERIDGWYVIKDYYNASPYAVEQALRSLEDFRVPGRRFAVLGDMRELGEMENDYHARVGEVAAELGLARLYTVGERGAIIARSAAAHGAVVEHCADAEAAAARLKQELSDGDVVLIKASRLMHLERVYEVLKA